MASNEYDTMTSWKMLAACAWIHMTQSQTIHGLLFQSLSDIWGISKEEASWPFSIGGSVSIIVGPLTGLYYNRVSPKTFATIGTLLVSVGYVSFFFTKNLIILSLTYGVLKGAGSKMIMTVTMPIILGYFKKYRATAMALSSVMVSLFNIATPYAVQWLIDSFGIQGCMLIMGAVNLNALAGCIVLKRPSVFDYEDHPDLDHLINDEREKLPILSRAKKPRTCSKGTFLKMKRIALNPTVYFFTISQLIFNFWKEIYGFTFYDFMSQKGISKYRSINLKTGETIGSTVGHLILARALDTKIKRPAIFVGVSIVLTSAIVFNLPYMWQFSLLMAVSVLQGTFHSTVETAKFIMYNDFFLFEDIALISSLFSPLHEILTLSKPSIIGFYGDVVGSYNGFFQIYSGILVVLGTFWLFEPLYHEFLLKFRGKWTRI